MKLELMAFTLVTAAAAVSPEPSLAAASWGGVKLLHLMAGAVGAGWTLSVMPALTFGKILSTGFMGISLAGIGTMFIVEKWGNTPPLSEAATLLIAAMLGCGGFYIIPGFVKFFERFGMNPFGVIDWWRKGDPPPPASGGGP